MMNAVRESEKVSPCFNIRSLCLSSSYSLFFCSTCRSSVSVQAHAEHYSVARSEGSKYACEEQTHFFAPLFIFRASLLFLVKYWIVLPPQASKTYSNEPI